MELPNIGQQCSQTDCKQLDFLPFQCKCGKQYCSEHFNQHIPNCETSCQLQTIPQKITEIHKCSRNDCNETSLVPLLCQKCGQHFCVKHRHVIHCQDVDEKTIAEAIEKCAAPVRQFNEAKNIVDKQIEHSLIEAKKKGKNKNLVNKVQLMKIKNKAKGLSTIPHSDRVYFNITCSGNDYGNPVFVSKTWSVGRAIDAIADACKLQNDNNKSESKKLRLFKNENGKILSKNLAESIQQLIANSVLIDGENLVIEYVEDDCEFLSK